MGNFLDMAGKCGLPLLIWTSKLGWLDGPPPLNLEFFTYLWSWTIQCPYHHVRYDYGAAQKEENL